MALLPRRTPADMPAHPPAPIPVRLVVIEECPCGATYQSSFNRDPVGWFWWSKAHSEHGFQEE